MLVFAEPARGIGLVGALVWSLPPGGSELVWGFPTGRRGFIPALILGQPVASVLLVNRGRRRHGSGGSSLLIAAQPCPLSVLREC